MKKLLSVLLCLAILSPILACDNKARAELEELEAKVQIEAYEFNELLGNIHTCISTLWNDFGGSPCWFSCPKGYYRDSTSRRISLNVEPSKVTITFKSNDVNWTDTKVDYFFRTNSPEEISNDIKGTVGEMFESNPYKGKSIVEQYACEDLDSLISRATLEINTLRSTFDDFVEYLKKQDNDYQGEYGCPVNFMADCYEKYTRPINIRLDEIEMKLQRLRNWDFTNLERYRELKAELSK